MSKAKYKVTYIEDGGKAHSVEVAEGWSLMEGAVKHLVPGIEALFEREGGDWTRFYDAAKALAALPKSERHKLLKGDPGA